MARYIGGWLALVEQFRWRCGVEVSCTLKKKGAAECGTKIKKIRKNERNGESRGRGRTCARAAFRMGGCYSGVKEEKIGRRCGVAGLW